MLADKLDIYKGRVNTYVNNNIQEIQKLYKEEEERGTKDRRQRSNINQAL